MAKKYHMLPLFQTRWVTFFSVDCNRDFHRKKYHHSEVRNTNKWCCCLNINPMLRNWKTIKNKPFASKQLFLKVRVFTVFSNKLLEIPLLGAEVGNEMWPEGATECESGSPIGTRLWAPSAPLWARHIAPPHRCSSSWKTERYLLSLLPLVGNMNE